MAEVDKVRPVGKAGRSAIYRALGKLYQAVPVAPGHYGWLSYLLADNTFRHPLTAEEAGRGYLLLDDEVEHAALYPQFYQAGHPEERRLTIELMGGPVISGQTYLERRTWSLNLGPEFTEWIDQVGGGGRDDILMTVVDAVEGRYLFRLQPRESRDEMTIHNRNIHLAMLAEAMMADNRRLMPALLPSELAARLIGRGMYRHAVPPDRLHFVLHHFSSLVYTREYGFMLETAQSEALNIDAGQQPVRSTLQTGRSAEIGWMDMMAETDGDDDMESFDEPCPAYEDYLAFFEASERRHSPLTHEEFHLLEAELEYLVALEVEFGALLPDQAGRKEELADRLFIDPDSLLNDDLSDYPDEEEPPFWRN